MLDLIRMKPQELRVLPRDKTWFFLSIGTVEDHGPHLPLGMDLLEGDAVLRALLQRLKESDPQIEGVQLPTFPLSIESVNSSLALHLRPHVVRDYLVDVVDSLYKEGFRYFAVYSGTFGPRQLTAVEEAGKFLRRKHRRFFSRKKTPILVSLASIGIDKASESRSLIGLDPPEHGGSRDTGFALRFFPKEVGPLYAELGIRPERNFFEQLVGRSGNASTRFWGSPEKADPESTERHLQEKITVWIPKLLATMQGVNGQILFRSKFSWLPSNHSLFRVYILGAALLLLFLGWIYFIVQTLVSGSL